MHTEARKQKIAESVRRAMTGRKLSDEHKRSLSQVALKREKKVCQHCGNQFTSNGIGQHEKACFNRSVLNE